MTRREEDVANEMLIINSHDYVLVFTNKGRAYRIKCYEIPEGSRTSKGMNISNLLPIDQEEQVTSMIKVSEFLDNKYLVMLTKHGVIKRIELNAFDKIRKTGIIALELDDGDELKWVKLTEGESELIIATKKGMSIRFKETDVRAVGRTARGVRSMRLKDSDEIAGMLIVDDEGKVLTISETGYGRLSDPSDYRLQSRGGSGVTNYHTQKYGDVAAIDLVNMDEDLIMISTDGVIIRIEVGSIRQCARPSKGVKVMKVTGNNKVVAVARVPHEEQEESESQQLEQAEAENEDVEQPRVTPD